MLDAYRQAVETEPYCSGDCMETQARQDAVIEIGSTGIRLLVADITASGDWAVVDRAERALALGRDVFTAGVITRESLLQCLTILNRYREILAGWGIPDERVSVVGTSAIREAKNRDIFLDRVAVKTGFRVHVVDGIEENRLMYLLVEHALSTAPDWSFETNSIIMDVGGGSTEIMLLKEGRMVAAHSFRMGTVIIERQIKAMMGSEHDMRRFLHEYMRTTAENLNNELRMSEIQQLVAIGSDARLVARSIGTQVTELLAVISRDAFVSFTEQVSRYSVEEIVQRFRLGYSDAESLVPGLLGYTYLLEMTAAETVLVPFLSIREGLIISRLSGADNQVNEAFYLQVIASAVNLGRKYHMDDEHSRYVTRIALKLFDSLKSELSLNRHARLLLETAAILHDVGFYIRPGDHHLHGQYIVANSDIFGLTREDIHIVANLVRYHRGENPSPAHSEYASLPRTDRTMVLKLSALLRVADALDRGHSQHIEDFDVELTRDTLFLRARGTHHITLERLALDEKAGLFEDVFGYKLVVV